MEERSEALRLGHYGIRCPLVLERLEWDETSGEVVYRARAGHLDGRGESTARGDVFEFPARVLDHLPDPGQQLLRYWGWYSNVARGRRERQQGEPSVKHRASMDPADGESRQRRLTWLWPQSCSGSQLIRKVYEVAPLLCPYCGATMRIIAFRIDFAPLRRLLAHMGFAPQQPEPLAHSPPVETELYVSNA